MTKAELVNAIAKEQGIDKETTTKILESFMDSVRESLISGENVYLRGFGTFQVKERAEKKARNISKNTTIVIAACKIPVFKPAKSFTSKVRESE